MFSILYPRTSLCMDRFAETAQRFPTTIIIDSHSADIPSANPGRFSVRLAAPLRLRRDKSYNLHCDTAVVNFSKWYNVKDSIHEKARAQVVLICSNALGCEQIVNNKLLPVIGTLTYTPLANSTFASSACYSRVNPRAYNTESRIPITADIFLCSLNGQILGADKFIAGHPLVFIFRIENTESQWASGIQKKKKKEKKKEEEFWRTEVTLIASRYQFSYRQISLYAAKRE